MAQRQLSASELQALVRLLGDSDERTVKVARTRLLEAGPEAVPWLHAAATSEPDAVVRGRARLLLDEVRFRTLKRRLAELARQDDATFDLEEGLFAVARARYPDLEESSYRQRLRGLWEELQQRRVGRMSPPEAAAAVNRYLFHELGFKSNEAHYYDPDNVCINQVLDRRTGVGVSLAALYLVVSRRAGFDVAAISVAGHVVVAVPGPVAFWVDPARSGRVLSRHDLAAFASEGGHRLDEAALAPLPDRKLVERMLAHLMRVYALTSQAVAAQRVEELMRTFTRGQTEEPPSRSSGASRAGGPGAPEEHGGSR
ncbi:transglutaminase-like domain-containing protein [Geochorda subterranea]|uniref:Transglutaminase-like domain-containing protein n=1 Tax=Geochorda subterranea TaxID=3109564 RepID=A0ABZ1BNE4_9FIRM|nr:transglutaminase-like domain-containing protein [Limnochorda sp. LNt]WRP14322.1 transglutaminase-like domain-containing protein [Limnochorda sp. LNt]